MNSKPKQIMTTRYEMVTSCALACSNEEAPIFTVDEKGDVYGKLGKINVGHVKSMGSSFYECAVKEIYSMASMIAGHEASNAGEEFSNAKIGETLDRIIRDLQAIKSKI